MSRPLSWRRGVARGLVSVWLVYHVCGLIVAPASIPPSSDLVRSCWPMFGRYLQLLNMNQGNHFFAPDPGASTIIRYTAELPGGGEVTGQMPDRQTSPRLLYHRHFMLTESLGATDPYDEQVRPLMIRALARELLHRHRASAVDLRQTVHLLAPAEWCRAGLDLNDPELFREQRLGRFLASDFVSGPDAPEVP